MTHNKILIKNCSLYEHPGKITNVYLESGKIKEISDRIIHTDALEINAEEKILCPGLIDVHIQGAGGADILDGTPEALRTISETLAKTGTTSFLATTVVKPDTGNKHLLSANSFVNKDLPGAAMLGYHLEGPFININKKGGLDPSSIYSPSPDALRDILQITNGNLKMMTIAPELPGCTEIIQELKRNNVIPAFAHSEADYDQTIKGFDAGISHVTHIFNAMIPLKHRDPGPITAIFETPGITAQIISDGHHLHPAIVKLIYKNIGPDRCVCITDGVQGLGLPEGNYFYNGREYTAKEGAARYLDGTLIGSVTSLAQIAVKFMKFTGCSLAEAINTASFNPAKVLGLEHCKGKIESGYDADLVLLDKNYNVTTTIVNGRIFNGL
jgi:N-acetylglucosamine-6-phosphate deacetylase